MRRISWIFLITSFLLAQLPAATASVIVPQEFQFSSRYGLDLKAKVFNQNPKSIDLVPGDVAVLEVSATLVDPLAVSWPMEVDDFKWNSSISKSLKITSYSFKGYMIGGWIYCKDNESYFKGNNINVVWANLSWGERASKARGIVKLPNKCSQLEFAFDITPTIQNIILEGNSKVTGISDFDYWQLEGEFSDWESLGNLGNHLNILRWSPIENVTLGMKKVQFNPTAVAGKVNVKTLTKSVCVISGNWILFARAGNCLLEMRVNEIKGYDAIPPTEYSFKIETTLEIQCVKGTSLKLVKGSNPKCPKGYKKA